VERDRKCSPWQVGNGALVSAVNVSRGGLAGWAGGFGSDADQMCLDCVLVWYEFVESKIGQVRKKHVCESFVFWHASDWIMRGSRQQK
jgi:hypothetical protein